MSIEQLGLGRVVRAFAIAQVIAMLIPIVAYGPMTRSFEKKLAIKRP